MSTEARLTSLENAVINLAGNKLDIVTHEAHISLEDARYLDLAGTITNLQNRIQALEEYIISDIAATGV